jgi:8-amino-7-oxononanoate synthase
MTAWTEWFEDQCQLVDASGQWRAPRPFDAAGPSGVLTVGGTDVPVVSFASNDYLGLSQHPVVKAAAHDAIDRWGTGSGAARLIVGSRPGHGELEEALAEWRGTEAAVLFPTGFAANLGVLATFGTVGVTICSDERNHASIIDGTRLARAEVSIYRHSDADDLDHALREARRQRPDGRTIVVTDTVFSMDGDVAPMDELVEVCRRHGSLLVLDEAHAVLGPDLVLDPEGRLDGVDVIRVGTLSKTLGSLGGFVAGSRRSVELLVNRARSYIFTTAGTPADAAAASAAVGIVRSPEGDALRAHLRDLIDRIAPGHPSPIIPVVIGDERDAVAAAQSLLDLGLLVPAIRPPTVAPGTSRLRIALSAAHATTQVDELVAALDAHGLRPSAPDAIALDPARR